jgi:4-hydroxybenzoate polyprenyltransferase
MSSGIARGFLGRTAVTLEMVKVSHTLFALPFALASLFLAAQGWPGAGTLGLVVLAVVLARAAALAFNRLVDAGFDARNPRTSGRALAAGRLSRGFAAGFVIACSGGFVATAAALNRLCLWLSPVALAVVLGYSYAKRFTALCHFWLGTALAIAPLAAWVAVKGRVDGSTWIPGALAAAVLLWVSGFDVIYSCQDAEVDRREGLRSIPSALGPRRALRVAALLHALMLAPLAAAGWLADFSAPYGIAVALIALLLVAQHAIARPDDPRRLEIAFFRLNAAVGPILMAAVLVEVFA